MQLDLSDLLSVQNFVKSFQQSFERLDVLINNAGANAGIKGKDGLMTLFSTNYLGHYLLFRLLAALPNSAPQLRVVNLSSVMHHCGSPDFKASAFGTNDQSQSYYDDSKFYMNLLTMEINKRNDKVKGVESVTTSKCRTRIRAMSANPGAVRSDIWRHVPRGVMWLYDMVMRLLFLDVEEGCASSVHAALLDDASIDEFIASHRPSTERLEVRGGKLVYHALIPYVVPYDMPLPVPLLAFELFGPFAGPRLGHVTVPPHASKIAADLWEFSEQLCRQQLEAQGGELTLE